MKLVAQCPAKINLTLDIVGKKDNGYHELETIMQSVSIYDTVTLNLNNTGNIIIKCDRAHIPTNDRNSVYKAVRNFFAYTQMENPGVCIDILKRIPVAAGLAGGSTDAAAVIIMLDRLLDTNLSKEQLAVIGLSVGADVPFCMFGDTALATGMGEQLTPVPCLPDCHIVLAKPAASLSTRLVYQEYDQNPSELHPFTGEVLEAMEKNNLGNICTRMFNVMEETAKRLCPEITNTQRIISDFSPMGMCMSGSGPTTFAIFDSEDVAQECRKALLGSRVEAHVVTPVRKIIIRKSV